MSDALTVEQQRALTLARVRLRLKAPEKAAPELTEDWQRKAAISATRAEHPTLAKTVDFLTGATGMVRGALNALTPSDLPLKEHVEALRDAKIRGTLGDRAVPDGGKKPEAPGFGDKVFSTEFASPDSGWRTAGALADPVAWATGMKAAQMAPYAKVLGGGAIEGAKALGRNIVGGAAPGALIGGLSDEGSAEGGAAIGAAANVVVPPAIKAVGTIAGKAATALSVKEKAAALLRKLVGGDLPAIKAATAAAPSDVTAAQSAAGVDNDIFNALDDLARRMDTESFFSRLDARQHQDLVDELTRLAGGSTQTEARQTAEASRRALGNVTAPMRETELAAANTAGRVLPKLSAQAEHLGEGASNKVGDVRRLEAAKQTAEEVARTGRMNLGGKPTPVLGRDGLAIGQPVRHQRGEELVDVAERGSQKAADDSLILGAGSRDAQMRADSLAQNGLKPLDTARLTGKLRGFLNDPKIGPSDPSHKALTSVLEKIEEWTAKGGGVIDAEALYTIRQNAVNDAIENLMGGATPKAKSAKAAGLLTKVKPAIDDAIEAAGGTEWRKYLSTYERGAREIERKRMGAKALELLERNPKKLESLVAGNEPKMVEKVFKTEYDLDLAMGSKGMQPLERVAADLARTRKMQAGAIRGESGMQIVMGAHKAKFRLPNWINAKIAVTNRALEELETRVNKKTMDALLGAMKTGKGANELLSRTPINERLVVLRALAETQSDPRTRALLMGIVSADQSKEQD